MTGAARLFKKAKELGFITSTDLVTENGNKFKEIIPCSLPYIDYFFLNDIEVERLTDMTPFVNG